MTKAKEKSREFYPLIHSEDWDREQELVAQQLDRRVAFVCGYEQAEKDTIERAVAWLSERGWTSAQQIKMFRKEMEEEQ